MVRNELSAGTVRRQQSITRLTETDKHMTIILYNGFNRKGTQMNNYINLDDQVTIQNNLWEKTDAFGSTELADVQSKYRLFRIRL